jgi:sugar phosphate isomerase/epimerase
MGLSARILALVSCGLGAFALGCSEAPESQAASGTAGTPSTGAGAATGGASAGVGASAGASGAGVAPGGQAGSSGGTTAGSNVGGAAGAAAGAGAGGVMLAGPAAWTDSPFIMDTWFWNDAADASAAIALVKQSGFLGFALSQDHDVSGYVSALNAAQLPGVGIWVPAALDAYPAGVAGSIETTGGLVMLSLNGGGFALSDAAGDSLALELITSLADECKSKGLPGVALYPHVGFWMQRVSDAVRLASKAARNDVGVVFNQYHWMAAEGGQDLAATLKSAEPYLRLVTLNGSDAQPSILPLGQGSYDAAPILQALSQLDFHGSVGLQGYGISGDIAGKLQSSKQAWDALVDALK